MKTVWIHITFDTFKKVNGISTSKILGDERKE